MFRNGIIIMDKFMKGKTAMLKITTSDKKFVDSEGRQRIFNGMNLCDKGVYVPGNPRKVYTLDFYDDLISKLHSMGFNLIRLGMTWDAIEPEPGKYDEEYLDKVEKVADLCEKYGIYFYLDMHQDLYGGPADAPADGAPAWACLTDGAKFKPTRFVWAEGYFWGKAVHNSFDNFWANKEYGGVPLQTYFCNMWKHVAERFKDHPALFGFDILNEPFPGSDGGKIFRKLIFSIAKTVLTDKRCKKTKMLKDLFSGEPAKVLLTFDDHTLFRKVTSAGDELIRKFDTGVYSQFINRTAKAIREITDNGVIIMENSYYSNLGIPYCAPAVSYDGKREEKLCFAPHAYDLMVDTPAYKYASDERVGSIFDEHRRSQERLEVPVIVGEWGSQAEGTEWLPHIEFLLDKFDSNKWSQTYWCYYHGLLETPIMDLLVRTAPVAVCGEIENYSFDRENDVFTLEYTQDKKYSVPTEIYLHKTAKSIECDGKYTLEAVSENGSAMLKIISGEGKHKVKVIY